MKKTLVIVGPNKGDSTIQELGKNHHEAWLFEPMPDAAEWLRANNNCQQVHIIQAACGLVNGTAKMTIYNGGLSSSLGECTQQARETYSQFDLSAQGEIEVDVVNLSEFLEANGVSEIETLLIDAQGMDLAILGTMQKWLESGRIKTVICEADQDGFRHYNNLPDNSVSGFMAFMSKFQYRFNSELTNLTLCQPDLRWDLIS